MWWPWRSRGAEPDPAERAGTGSPPPPSAAPRDGWRTLPALQRTTHEAESACHLDTFPATLATRQDPRFLEPLGHSIDPSAPSGRVEGIAQPTGRASIEFTPPPTSAAADAPAPSPSVQRSSAPASPPALPPTPPSPAPREPAADTLAAAAERPPNAPSPEAAPEPIHQPSYDEPIVAPTIGLEEQPLVVEPGPAATAVESDAGPVVAPSNVTVVARTLAAATRPTTPTAPTAPGGPGALPDVTPRAVPSLPLPVAAQRAVESPDVADSPPAPEQPVAEQPVVDPSDVPVDPPTPTAVDLLGERPIRVEEPPITTPLPPAPTAVPTPTTTAPAVQRAVTRPEEPHAGPGRSPSRPALPIQRTADPAPSALPPVSQPATPAAVQRTEVSAAPVAAPLAPAGPLAPPALAWPPPPPAAKPTPVRPVPTPGLTVQAVAADQATGPARTARAAQAVRTVQRVVTEPLPATAGAGLPEPAVTLTAFVPERLDLPAQASPALTVSNIAAPTSAASVGPSLHLQRSTTTIPAALPVPLPVPVGGQPPVPESAHTTTYESMPASIRSMPLQRLLSAATPQAPRPALPTRPSGPLPEHTNQVDHPVTDGTDGTASTASTASTEVAIHWEQPPATVQRAEESGAEAAESPAPETPAAAAVASAPGAPPAPGKPGGADMDELARRLYAPMSALLRAELWLDRERSGRSMTR